MRCSGMESSAKRRFAWDKNSAANTEKKILVFFTMLLLFSSQNFSAMSRISRKEDKTLTARAWHEDGGD